MTRGEDSNVPLQQWRSGTRLYEAEFPLVMGILNATPDSFHPESRIGRDDVLRKAGAIIKDGAALLDVGGASSRPGAQAISVQEELDRVLPVVAAIRSHFPDVIISIDTYRAAVAEQAVAAGAGMVNDIGAGILDPEMLGVVARSGVPYVIMHMQGTPQTMQRDPQYRNVVGEVVYFLSERIKATHAAGIADLIVDPGFGFGKTTTHNMELLAGLTSIAALGFPVLAGLSRKRMINEVLGTVPAEALNGTTVLNTVALLKGAQILRVHDVREAMQCIRLVTRLRDPHSTGKHG